VGGQHEVVKLVEHVKTLLYKAPLREERTWDGNRVTKHLLDVTFRSSRPAHQTPSVSFHLACIKGGGAGSLSRLATSLPSHDRTGRTPVPVRKEQVVQSEYSSRCHRLCVDFAVGFEELRYLLE
jgi:hypothetical protein